jgi:glutamyl-Q tRNA(Asp) synthetase
VAATASYLQALVADGAWLLRIENIDPPREVPGAADAILQCLDAHGFEWSGHVRWQQDRHPAHLAAIAELERYGLAFHCNCTRAQIRGSALTGAVGPVYPGTCRHKSAGTVAIADSALRIAVAPCWISVHDRLQGLRHYRLDRDIGAFVIRRRDGLVAYALAATLDDHAQGITEVVRGTDLLPMTPAQLWLQRLLDLRQPRYLHVPVVRNPAGEKLSKQTGALPVDPATPGINLVSALRCLGQQPPDGLEGDVPARIWAWACEHWDPALAGRETGATGAARI